MQNQEIYFKFNLQKKPKVVVLFKILNTFIIINSIFLKLN